MPEPRLFAEVPLATADELLDVLAPHHGRELWDRPDTDWIFRGQAESAWTLRPSALRPGALDAYLGPNFTPPSTPEEHREAELRAVMGFASRATERGYEIPWDSHEIRDWDTPPLVTGFDVFPPSRFRAIFGLAQHYGIPTRLLDWTFNPLAGAYFAAKPVAHRIRRGAGSPTEGDGRFAVWALAYWFLVHHCRWWAPGVVPVTVPASSNPNLTAQRGAFTLVRFMGTNIPERLPPDLDALFVDPENVAGSHRDGTYRDGTEPANPSLQYLYKFTVPHSEAPALLYYLDRYGVNAASIFPGHAFVSESMREDSLRAIRRPHGA